MIIRYREIGIIQYTSHSMQQVTKFFEKRVSGNRGKVSAFNYLVVCTCIVCSSYPIHDQAILKPFHLLSFILIYCSEGSCRDAYAPKKANSPSCVTNKEYLANYTILFISLRFDTSVLAWF